MLCVYVLQVHRFHPPLAYGRTMGCTPEASVGAALCKVEQGITGQPCFGVITYAYVYTAAGGRQLGYDGTGLQ